MGIHTLPVLRQRYFNEVSRRCCISRKHATWRYTRVQGWELNQCDCECQDLAEPFCTLQSISLPQRLQNWLQRVCIDGLVVGLERKHLDDSRLLVAYLEVLVESGWCTPQHQRTRTHLQLMGQFCPNLVLGIRADPARHCLSRSWLPLLGWLRRMGVLALPSLR
jgi:hypothetical protein